MTLFQRLFGGTIFSFDPATIAVLNRLLDHEEAAQQREINAATEALTSATKRLKTSTNNLQQAIEGSK